MASWLVSTWKGLVFVANFKEIMAMCLDGASYSRITTVLGCSRRDVSRVKAIIAEESITAESFRLLPPGWFVSRFSDGRRDPTPWMWTPGVKN